MMDAGSADQQRTLGRAELCFSRALQLNPKRAITWAALGRLYAAQDRGTDDVMRMSGINTSQV